MSLMDHIRTEPVREGGGSINLTRVVELHQMTRELQQPFPAKDVEWRVSREVRNGQAVHVLAYLTARAIQARLDEVCTPFGWRCSYHTGPDGGVICRLDLLGPNGWVSKEDGAENTQVEAVKGGISSALKRAAVAWGIGRYLYDLPRSVVPIQERGDHPHKIKATGKWGYWNAPQLPQWALPAGGSKDTTPQANASQGATVAPPVDPGPTPPPSPPAAPPPEPLPEPPTNGTGEAIAAFETLFAEHQVGEFERSPLVLWAATRLNQKFTWADVTGGGDHPPSLKTLRAAYGLLKRHIGEALKEIRNPL